MSKEIKKTKEQEELDNAQAFQSAMKNIVKTKRDDVLKAILDEKKVRGARSKKK